MGCGQVVRQRTLDPPSLVRIQAPQFVCRGVRTSALFFLRKMTLSTVLLAAGHGTRMNSKRQKVLHEVGGKPMLLHGFEAAETVADLKPVVVVGAGESGARQLLGQRAQYAVQEKRLGTGHATLMARPLLESRADQVLVTYGDMPLLQAQTLRRLADKQKDEGAVIAMLSVRGDPQSSFGRVLRGEDGRVVEIVEVAQARRRPDAERLLAIGELNAGVYCFDASWMWTRLTELPVRKARSGEEYYLTDMVALAAEEGRRVEAIVAEDADECLGAGTRLELASVERALRRRINRRWLEAGVTLIDPRTTYIDDGVRIGQDTVIWPNTYLQGHTIVGEDCVLGPNTIVRDATIGDGCRAEQAFLEGVTLESGTTAPPMSRLKGQASGTRS